MAFFDLPLDQLRTYKPQRDDQPDFDSFWAETLKTARGFPLDPQFTPVDFGLSQLDTYDVTFNGYGGQPIKAWFLIPKQRSGPVPCVVEFIGYGSGRSWPTDWLLWSSVGVAHLIMDSRGQGSGGLHGDTPDNEDLPNPGPQHPGVLTKGVLSKETFYYRRIMTDTARAVECAQGAPGVDPDRIAVTGGSQGGGLAIAAAGLSGDSVKLALPTVPFLCGYRRATQIQDTYPYKEIALYLLVHRDQIDTVFHTLSYFDGINLAARATAKTLFSVGLMDEICPPSTIFAAYNHWKGEKQIEVYEYNHHEGGGAFHVLKMVKFLRENFGL